MSVLLVQQSRWPANLPLVIVPKEFAELLSADHKVLSDVNTNRHKDKAALVVQDQGTKFVYGYPVDSKNATATTVALNHFLGDTKCQLAYSDNSQELKKAFEDLGVVHDHSTPNEPQTNGSIERAVRRVKEGTTCALVQSGLSTSWWAEAMKTYLLAQKRLG